jgi:tight adherence protein C
MYLDWMALLVAGGFLLSLTAGGAMLFAVVGTERGAARRLQRRLAPSEDLPDLVAAPSAAARLMSQGLTPIARLAQPVGEEEQLLLRGKLARAGYRSPAAIQAFLASKVMLALLSVAGVLWANAVRLEPLPMVSAWAVGLACVGFLLPNLWLEDRVKSRMLSIDRGLPEALDLMVTSVEAGLGLDSALQRVAAELVLARPVLAQELTLTFLEVKAGVARADAYRRLANRTGVQDLKTLAATLNQTELFGTSVAAALRIQAEGMRIRRMQKAEERAAMLSVKMTLPLVLCFLPSLMAVLIGPAVVNIAVNFLNKGTSP